MLTKGALSIVGSRFSLVYKVILYIVICIFIFGVIGYAGLAQTLRPIMSEVADVEIGQTFVKYITSLFRGVIETPGEDGEAVNMYDLLINKIGDIKDIVVNNINTVISGLIVLLLIIFIFGLFYTALFYPSTKILSEFMSSNSKYGFSSCYIATLGRSMLFSLSSMVISIVYYLLTITASFGLAYLASKWSVFVGFTVFFLGIGLAVSIKGALFLGWLPAYVVDEKSIGESMKTSFKMANKSFWSNLIVLYTFYLIFIAITINLAIVTFFTAVPFFLGFILVFNQAYALTSYYHYKGYKYYKDAQTVVDPKKVYGNTVLENPVKHGSIVSGDEKADKEIVQEQASHELDNKDNSEK